MADTTDSGDKPLHMLQMRLPMKGLIEIGKMHGLRLKDTDDNYLVHCALGKLFQDKAPKPYAVEKKDGKQLRVLGYAQAGADELQTQAQAFAEPRVFKEFFDWEYFSSKPMPDAMPEGMQLAFEIRVCPVIRKASAGEYIPSSGDDSQKRTWSEGQELDAFLAEVWKPENEGVDLDRETIYCDWLRDHFGRRDSLEAVGVSMQRFSIERMTRRHHGGDRTARTIKRPDVTMTGSLRVTDGRAFMDVLKKGIGRHKSFGFGMLKVRPA